MQRVDLENPVRYLAAPEASHKHLSTVNPVNPVGYVTRSQLYFYHLLRVMKNLGIKDANALDTELGTHDHYAIKHPPYTLARLGQFKILASMFRGKSDEQIKSFEVELYFIAMGTFERSDTVENFRDNRRILQWLAYFEIEVQPMLSFQTEKYLQQVFGSDKLKPKIALLVPEAISISQFAKEEKITIDQALDWVSNKEMGVLLYVLIYQNKYPLCLSYIIAEYLISEDLISGKFSPVIFYQLAQNSPEIKLLATSDEQAVVLFGIDAFQWINNNNYKIQKNAENNLYSLSRNNVEINGSLSLPDIASHIASQPGSTVFVKKLLNYLYYLKLNPEKLEAKENICEKARVLKMSKARNYICEEARVLMYSGNLSVSEQKFVINSIVNVINVIQNPLDVNAVQALHKSVTEVPGTSSLLKHFLGAVTMLLGIAVIGLSITGIPFTGGASLIAAYSVGGALLASSACFFAHGRQKGLSKQLSNFADAAPLFSNESRVWSLGMKS